MLLESTRFGEVEIDDDALVLLPEGLIGLEGTLYALIATADDSPFHWLQSTEHPSLAVPVASPGAFFFDYEVSVSEDDATALSLEDPEGTEVLCVIRAGERLEDCTINLAAPIVVNAGTRHGRQVINGVRSYDVRQPLLSALQTTSIKTASDPRAHAIAR